MVTAADERFQQVGKQARDGWGKGPTCPSSPPMSNAADHCTATRAVTQWQCGGSGAATASDGGGEPTPEGCGRWSALAGPLPSSCVGAESSQTAPATPQTALICRSGSLSATAAMPGERNDDMNIDRNV